MDDETLDINEDKFRQLTGRISGIYHALRELGYMESDDDPPMDEYLFEKLVELGEVFPRRDVRPKKEPKAYCLRFTSDDKKFLADGEFLSSKLFDSIQEAKRFLDSILAFDTPEIPAEPQPNSSPSMKFPPSKDKNLDGLRAALKDANYPQVIEGYCDTYRQIEHKLASGLEVSPGDRAEYERIKALIQAGYSLRDVMVYTNVGQYLALWGQNNPGMLSKLSPEFKERLFRRFFRVFAAAAEG
jgi:hypothetical protein